MGSSLQTSGSVKQAADQAIERAATSLLRRQTADGFWWADLRADSTLESDYIMMELWLHPPRNGVWNPPTRDRVERAVNSILSRQLSDGGFNIYLNGPSEVNASIKAYFALKVAGLSSSDSRMQRLCARILELGGLQAANSYVRINLGLFGLFPRDACPSIPPEIILLPFRFIYQMSSWTRAIVIPLAVVHASNPRRPVPAGFNVDELFLAGAPMHPERDPGLFSWRNCFLSLDKFLKFWERVSPGVIRRYAIQRCEEWMRERFDGSDGLGAIYPSMQYAVMALDVLGYKPDHPLRIQAEKEFYNLMVDNDSRGFYMQPCFSPIWDTAIAAVSLAETGSVPASALRATADWLISKEIRRRGDWSVKRPNTEPSGWAFEFNNEFYPDVDDTAMVLLALDRIKASDEALQRACQQRAVTWLLAMQGKDGGWAAFDVDNNWSILSDVPFADHNAMLDPSCPDITGRVLEALSKHLPAGHSALQRGVRYLTRVQEQDGSWFGRWGVNYIYGTFLALRGLRATGVDENEPFVQYSLEFIRAFQNRDGGWGESCASYDENCYVNNPSTPSQTAWAILALLAGGDIRSESLHNGVDYLVSTQRTDGTWDEDYCTGTGFPRVFYLAYTDYRNTFPLLALTAYRKAVSWMNGDAVGTAAV